MDGLKGSALVSPTQFVVNYVRRLVIQLLLPNSVRGWVFRTFAWWIFREQGEGHLADCEDFPVEGDALCSEYILECEMTEESVNGKVRIKYRW